MSILQKHKTGHRTHSKLTRLGDLTNQITRNWISGDLKGKFVFEFEGIDKAHILLLRRRQSLEQTFQQTFRLNAWVQDATRQNMCNETILDQEDMTRHCCYTGLQPETPQAVTHFGIGWRSLHNRTSRTYMATGHRKMNVYDNRDGIKWIRTMPSREAP